MPQKQLLHFECDNCKSTDTIDVSQKPADVLTIIAKWRSVLPGDAANDGRDHHRWYCRYDCLVAGEARADKERAENAAFEAKELTKKSTKLVLP